MANQKNDYVLDFKLSELFNDIFVMCPFVSRQKEFGYSDIYDRNGNKRFLDNLYRKTEDCMLTVKKVRNYWLQAKDISLPSLSTSQDITDIKIKTYIIKNIETEEFNAYAQSMFKDHPEFEWSIKLIDHNKEWAGVQEMVHESQNTDDVVVICKPTFSLSSSYDVNTFVTMLQTAAHYGCQLLIGTAGRVGNIIPVTSNLWWFDMFRNSSFIVVFRLAFSAILGYKSNDGEALDEILSKIIPNKMVIWPFVFEDYTYSKRNKIEEHYRIIHSKYGLNQRNKPNY